SHLERVMIKNRPDHVLVVNYFGFPAEMGPLKEVLTPFNVKIIEDNAHGFLSTDTDGQWLGLRGDWGIFSFRKSFPVYNGAVVAKKGAMAVKQPKRSYFQPHWKFKAKDLLRQVAFILGPPLFVKLLEKLRKPIVPQLRSPNFSYQQPINMWLEVSKFDLLKNSKNRRDLFNLLLKQTDILRIEPVFKSVTENVVPYCFPFWPKADVQQIEQKFKKMGLEIFHWPDLTPESSAQLEPEFKNIWAVRFIW
ncbi:MAG: DegT/DnrJ/EryC1/StrS family aminotransferase, partial [Bdellovibrionota bacterium]